ncbi:MAG: sigma-70 family RNA polymerase sigma factor, partial [Acidobacteriota bacterium]
LPRFRREARFDTWLYQVAANTCRKALRDRHVQKRRLDIEAKSMTDLPDDVVPEDGRWSGRSAAPGALGGLLSEERSQRLRRAIATLPVRMRTCLALRIYQELSYQEIAVAMRLSVETVKAHLYQARRRLEKEMGERAVPGDGARQTAQAKRQAVKEKG